MKSLKTWLPSLIIALTVIVQSTLLSRVPIFGVTPDLALILLIFFSNRMGSMKGQISGFAAGIIEDVVSLSPIGFHAFIKTVSGFLFGLTRGKIFMDPVFMPLVLTAGATLLKYLLAALLGVIFVSSGLVEPVFTAKMGIEIGLNALISPFLFGFMKLFKAFKRVKKEDF
jgi:rod shape-determining protein MreD